MPLLEFSLNSEMNLLKGEISYMKKYKGFIPHCGIYCEGCPNYLRAKNPCLGAENHCLNRNVKEFLYAVKKKRA